MTLFGIFVPLETEIVGRYESIAHIKALFFKHLLHFKRK
jgi:hypothetical protein